MFARTLSRFLLVIAVGLAACSTDRIVTPEPTGPSLDISDAVHNGGNAHFFFLPPMVRRPQTTGAFDISAQPSVVICSLAAVSEAQVTPGSTCDGRYALSVPYGTSGHDVVRMHPPRNGDEDDDSDDDEDQGGHFHYKWRVPESAVKFYRITIRLGASTLGFADVETANNNRDLKNVQTQEFIPRKDGQTLQIKFRIDQGAIVPVPAWLALSPMPTARQWVSTAAVGQRIYVVGGWSGSNLAVNEAYDAVSQSWVTLAPMTEARYAGTGAQAINGKLYLAGGSNGYPSMTNSLFVYNIAMNSWTTGPDAPAAVGCGASATVSGKLYVFSGCTNSFTYDSSLTSYDPASGVWATLPPAPHIHLYPSAVAVGGQIYIISGINSTANMITGTVDVFDINTNTWSAGPTLPTARYSASAVLLSGKIYVLGGTMAPGGSALNTVEVYDTTAHTWSTSLPLPTARWDAGAGVLNGRIIVAGGTASGLSWLNTTESYQP